MQSFFFLLGGQFKPSPDSKFLEVSAMNEDTWLLRREEPIPFVGKYSPYKRCQSFHHSQALSEID